jgi:MFS family permease
MALSPRYKWTVLALFWFIYFMNQADRQVLFSVFPLIQREFGLSDASLGLLGSVFFWVYAVLVPVAGALGDRLTRKSIVVFALLVWSAATAVSGLVSGFVLLVAFRALTGAGEAFYYPAANSIIGDYHGRGTRALAMSIHQTSVYLGIVGSGTLAGYVGQVYGWRTAFLVFGGVGVALAVLASRLLREPERGASEAEPAAPPPDAGGATLLDHIRHSASSPTFWALGAAFLCFKLVDAAYLAWMPTLLYRKFSLSLATAGFHATFWHHAGAFLGVLVGGRLSDRWALRSTLGRPLVQVAGLAVGAPFIYMLGVSGEQAVVYGGLALFGVFRGLYDSNLFASLYEVVRPASRATATGMMLCAAFLGGGAAPLVIGYLSRQFPLGQAMAYTSVLYLIGALIILADCGLWFRRDAARIHSARPLVLEHS